MLYKIGLGLKVHGVITCWYCLLMCFQVSGVTSLGGYCSYREKGYNPGVIPSGLLELLTQSYRGYGVIGL